MVEEVTKNQKKVKFKKKNTNKINIRNRKINISSIKTKLIVYFSILILVSLGISGVVSNKSSSDGFIEMGKDFVELTASEGSRLTESRIDTQMRTLEMLAMREDILGISEREELLELRYQVEKSGFDEIGIVGLDGNVLLSDGSTTQMGNLEYIKKAFNGESDVSDPIISPTGENIVIYTTPIMSGNGNVVGAIVGYRDGNALSEIVDDTGFGERGYGYIINENGTVIAHPDRSKVTSQFSPIEEAKNNKELESIGELFERILENKSGTDQYYYGGQSLYAGYVPIENSDWTYVMVANEAELLSVLPRIKRNSLVVSITVLLISMIATYFISKSLADPISNAIRLSEKIGDLDITVNVPQIDLDKEDEIGTWARAFQRMIDNLRQVTQDISQSSEQVAASSQELMATTEESAAAAEEVTRTMEEVAKGAEEQAHNTQEGATKAELLGKAIQENKEYLEGLNDSASQASTIIIEGLAEIEELTKITEQSESAIEEIHRVILRTDESSNQISQASNVIASIAEQTNLLALNAAIEAARAGEAGRGFAVVAEEIRKLAEQSSESTTAIDRIVNELQDNSKNAVKTMEEVSEITQKQTNSVESNKQKYTEINKAIEYAIKATIALNNSEEHMEELNREISGAMENLTAIAEENAAATEQASASMEEQSASVEEISGTSEGLSNLAEDLNSIIERFKI